MPLEATDPGTLSATYDLWAFTFATYGLGLALPGEPAPADTINARADLVKYRVRPDGVAEMSPLPSDRATITVPDLYALAATNATVAAAMAALIAAVGEIATMQGKL
jgi:hypothetical protein